MSNQTPPQQLKRELGVFGATLMGLGSIVGTGVFVSIGIAADIAGPSVILAVAIAAVVATCNGLNSAQLAANHPVSGGTYEYGYKYLNRWWGFVAGWMFLIAKTASAATAALGFSGYLLNIAGFLSPGANENPGGIGGSDRFLLISIALGAVVAIAAIVFSGIRRSNLANVIIVSTAMLSLTVFVLAGLPKLVSSGFENLTPFFSNDENAIGSLLQAAALMFVAYTGYGRIATLGEEVREPRRTIPRAMIVTMLVTMVLYMSVAFIAVGASEKGSIASGVSAASAPLEIVASGFGIPGVSQLIAAGAMTAMLGVLLNLILGLSRVLLAMGRRRDLPRVVATLNASQTTPYVAVIVVGVAIALLVLIGDVKTTWSFSAFNVLIYYAITNFAALRLPPEARLFPRWLGWVGLASCLFLAFWVERQIWVVGLGTIVVGLVWHGVVWKLRRGDN